MPPVGSLLGQVDFADLKYIIQSASPESKPGAGDSLTEVAISYGAFINHIPNLHDCLVFYFYGTENLQ